MMDNAQKGPEEDRRHGYGRKAWGGRWAGLGQTHVQQRYVHEGRDPRCRYNSRTMDANGDKRVGMGLGHLSHVPRFLGLDRGLGFPT